MGYYDTMRHWLLIDGKPTKDFGVYLSGNGTFKAPEKEVEEFTIPGRNGSFHYKNTRYKNVKIAYKGFIYQNFRRNVAAFRSYLLSRSGYFRLEDTHNPGEFRLATYHEEFNPDVFADLTAAQFTINFDCKPERYLLSGEREVEFTANGKLINPTYFDAKPLITCYGSSGTVNIAGVRVSVTNVTTSCQLDCEEKETIPVSLNDKTTLTDGDYPVLKPGENTISFTGFTKVVIKPRWWTL